MRELICYSFCINTLLDVAALSTAVYTVHLKYVILLIIFEKKKRKMKFEKGRVWRRNLMIWKEAFLKIIWLVKKLCNHMHVSIWLSLVSKIRVKSRWSIIFRCVYSEWMWTKYFASFSWHVRINLEPVTLFSEDPVSLGTPQIQRSCCFCSKIFISSEIINY